VQARLLGAFACELGHAGHSLAFVLTLFDFCLEDVGHVFLMDVQEIVHLALEEVSHILVDGVCAGCHERGAELNLGLTLENRLFDVHRDGRHHAVTDIGVFVVFVEKLLDGLGDVLFERTLVSAALRGVLPVDEAMILLAILVCMCEGDLDILTLDMDDGVKAVYGHVVVEQIFQSVAALDTPTVIHDGQSGVEIGVVAQHGLHDFVVELIVLEQGVVGLEEDERTVLVGCFRGLVAEFLSFGKLNGPHLAVSEAPHLELGAEGIDGLHAHAV